MGKWCCTRDNGKVYQLLYIYIYTFNKLQPILVKIAVYSALFVDLLMLGCSLVVDQACLRDYKLSNQPFIQYCGSLEIII